MARVNEACDLSPPFLDYLRVDFIKISRCYRCFRYDIGCLLKRWIHFVLLFIRD